MPVLINFKICDNSPFCDGIAACPTGALYFDRKANKLSIDKDKCTECGKCVCCSAGAIHFAKTEKEAKRIKREIEADTRTEKDLFVNRYGAVLLPDICVIEEDDFEIEVLNYPHKRVVELVTEDSINCLVHSIPINRLFERHKDWHYRRILLRGQALTKEYKIIKFPCLLFFDKGKYIGKVEGYYDDSQIKLIHNEIDKVIENSKH